MTSYFGPEFQPIRLKDQHIPHSLLNPHYSDGRFLRTAGRRTIYLTQGLLLDELGESSVKGLHYNYSDRLAEEYGHDKVAAVQREAEETVGAKDTATYFQDWLRRLYDDETTNLHHMIAGFSTMTGYPYLAFGTGEPEQQMYARKDPSSSYVYKGIFAIPHGDELKERKLNLTD